MSYYNNDFPIILDNGIYHLNLRHPNNNEPIIKTNTGAIIILSAKPPPGNRYIEKENDFGQPLIPGYFLLTIFNLNLHYLDFDSLLFSIELNSGNFVDIIKSSYSGPKMYSSMNDITLANTKEIYSKYYNCNFKLRTEIVDYYSEKGIDFQIFREIFDVLVNQLHDTLNEKADNYKTRDKTKHFALDLQKIQMFSHMIIEGNSIPDDCLSIMKSYPLKMCFDKNTSGQLIQKYYIHSIFELFSLDAYMYINSPSKSQICFCKLCGRYFIKKGRKTEAYCQYPNPHFNDKSCSEYHKEHPNYHDPISKIVSNAQKAQNKYYNNYIGLSDNKHNIWNIWTYELKQREKKARITRDTAPLKHFIENTKFSKTGFSDIDYSKL